MKKTMGLTDDPQMKEIRERRDYFEQEWAEIKEEAKKDRMCVAGQPWQAVDPKGVKSRLDANRPFVALDELGQYINQTVNDVRANPRGIKFAPTGNGANDKGAEFYQNHVREIEYRSKAMVAYTTAFENAVTSGAGWLRVTTKRQHIRTFDRDIWIEPIVNPDQVLADPNATWPDSRDMKGLFYIEAWPIADFHREFPKAKVQDFNSGVRNIANRWFQGQSINVAEYWTIDTLQRKLIAYQPSADAPIVTILEDELPDGKLPPGVENIRTEMVDDMRVKAWMTNGLELLKEIPWKGKHIPFVSCFGKVMYVEGSVDAPSKRALMSMTRLAREPYMLYCYMATCEAENVGGITRASWVGLKGSFANPEIWRKAAHEPVEFLEVEPHIEGLPPGTATPLPQRQSWDTPLQNIEMAKESARRAIQAAMGISPLPTEAQRHNDKSGVALKQIESSGQRGSFHFVDHYDLMIERAGVIIEDLMDKTLDTMRKVPVRKSDDSSEMVTINDVNDPDGISTKGDYRTTVSSGPANESQRAAADDILNGVVANIQPIAQMAGPKVALKLLAKSIKIKLGGPEADDIAALLDPPQPGADGKPIPPEMQTLMQQLQQAQGENQQMKQAMESKVAEKQAEQQAKLQGDLQLKGLDLAFQREKLERDSETKITVAELAAKVDRLTLFLEERARLGLQVHESTEQAKDRVHDVNMAKVAHAAATAQADQSQGHTLEQGDQGVQGQLAVQAAAPEPVAGASA